MNDETILLGSPRHGQRTGPTGNFTPHPISWNTGNGNPVLYRRITVTDPDTNSVSNLQQFWYVYATDDDATPISEIVDMLKREGISPLGEQDR